MTSISKKMLPLERLWGHRAAGRAMKCRKCGVKLNEWNSHHHSYCDKCYPSKYK